MRGGEESKNSREMQQQKRKTQWRKPRPQFTRPEHGYWWQDVLEDNDAYNCHKSDMTWQILTHMHKDMQISYNTQLDT